MTRIDTPLATPAADKPADKTVGKATSKNGDNRQAAFRSLLRQLGGQESAAGGTNKEAKTLPGDTVTRGLPTIRHRAGTTDDKAGEATPEASADARSAEPAVGGEPVLAWQAILGGGATTERPEQPTAAVDLTALISARAPDAEAPAEAPDKAGPAASDHFGRSTSAKLPSTAGLELANTDATRPATTDTTDPFAALSSLLDKATDTAAEPETTDIAPMKMSVVARETHFEPVARLSPVQQIATAVGEQLASASEPVPTETASQTTEPARHSAGPLKVLHIKLEPEDLGAVVLKMRLVDKSLELEVVASRQETADLLAKDRDMLTRALRGSGYTADVVTISTSTAPDGGQQSTGDNRAGSQPSSGQSGAQAGGNRSSNDPAGNGGRSPARPQPVEGATHEESGTGRSGSDLYL